MPLTRVLGRPRGPEMISELRSGAPSPAQRRVAGGSGSSLPRVLCGPRGSQPAGRRIRTPPPSADCRSSPPPARESPHWSRCWSRPGGSGRRGSCPPDSPPWQSCPTPGCVAPRGFRAQGHHFFLPLVLFVRGRPTPPPPRPSPLPPHVGTAPLGQAFFLSSSSSCLEKAPIFFLSFHLRDILITSPFFTKIGMPSLDYLYTSPWSTRLSPAL